MEQKMARSNRKRDEEDTDADMAHEGGEEHNLVALHGGGDDDADRDDDDDMQLDDDFGDGLDVFAKKARRRVASGPALAKKTTTGNARSL